MKKRFELFQIFTVLMVMALFTCRAQVPVTLSVSDATGTPFGLVTTFTPATVFNESFPNAVYNGGITCNPSNGVVTTNLLEGPYVVSFLGSASVLYRYVPGWWVTNMAPYTTVSNGNPLNLQDPRWGLKAFQTTLIVTNYLTITNTVTLSEVTNFFNTTNSVNTTNIVYTTNYYTVTNPVVVLAFTNAQATNAMGIVSAGQALFIGTNYDVGGAAAAAFQGGSNLSYTLSAAGTNYGNGVFQSASNLSYTLVQSGSNNAAAVFLANSNLSSSLAASGTNTALAAFQSASNLTYTLGANGTNYANGAFQSASNLSYTLVQSGSNNAAAVFLASSNLSSSLAASGTNTALAAFQSSSNLTYTLGANGTNYANGAFQSASNLSYTLVQSGSNNAAAVFLANSNLSSSLAASGTNTALAAFQSASNLSYTLGANGTNYANGAFQSASNLSYTLAQNGSNNAAAVFLSASNFTVSATINGTNGANAVFQASSNLTYVLGGYGTNYGNGVFQSASNLSYTLVQSGSNNAAAIFLANSNLSSSLAASGTNTALAAFQSASNLTYTLGANGTNYGNGVFQSASNLSYTLVQSGSNNTAAVFLANSNLSSSLAASGTNTALAAFQSASNLTYTLGANGTNYANGAFQSASNLSYTLVQNGSNNAAAIFLANSNLSSSLAASGTNTALAAFQSASNLSYTLGANGTNYANGDTNRFVGTNAVAIITTNYLILSGAGTAGANTAVPDNAGYYISDGFGRLTNAVNGNYVSNNGALYLLNTAAGATLSTFAHIGDGSSGTIAAGTAPAGRTFWAVMQNHDVNGEVLAGKVNGSNVVGTVPLTSLPGSIANNPIVSYIGTNNPFFLTNVLLSQAGQLWSQAAKPWVLFLTNPNSNYITASNAFVAEGEAYIAQSVLYLETNGWLSSVTNQGAQPTIYINPGLTRTRCVGAATNWGFYDQNWGTMQWDTNMFPHGPWWIANFCHTNGFKIVSQEYISLQHIPAGADALICNFSGGGVTPYTNGFAYPTNGAGAYCLIGDFDNIQKDEAELQAWGFDGVVWADGLIQTSDNFIQALSMAADGAVSAWEPVGTGLGQSQYPGYLNVNTSLFTSAPGFSRTPSIYLFGHPLAVVNFESSFGFQQNYSAGSIYAPLQTGVTYDNNAQVIPSFTGGSSIATVERDFAGSVSGRQGNTMLYQTIAGNDDIAAAAMLHCWPMGALPNETVQGSTSTPATSNLLTNAKLISILTDPLCNWPLVATNYSGLGQCWYERLQDGTIAVATFSTNGTFQGTILWPELGLPTNMPVHVYDVIDGVDKGIVTASYSQTWSENGGNSLQIFAPLSISNPTSTNFPFSFQFLSPSGNPGNVITIYSGTNVVVVLDKYGNILFGGMQQGESVPNQLAPVTINQSYLDLAGGGTNALQFLANNGQSILMGRGNDSCLDFYVSQAAPNNGYNFNANGGPQFSMNSSLATAYTNMTVDGCLTLHTNLVCPAPITGSGTFYASNNGDLYWVTATKTNLVVLGH